MTKTTEQHRITTPGPLHKPDGSLAEPGWATDLLLRYDCARVKAPAWRVKEWDYYGILARVPSQSRQLVL